MPFASRFWGLSGCDILRGAVLGLWGLKVTDARGFEFAWAGKSGHTLQGMGLECWSVTRLLGPANRGRCHDCINRNDYENTTLN